MPHRASLGALVVLALIATSCGADSSGVAPTQPDSTATTTTQRTIEQVRASTTSSVAPPSATTSTAPTTTSTAAVDVQSTDRSVLELVANHGPRGRFVIVPGVRSFVPRTEGRHWELEDGSVYTVLDVDPELIAREMDRLVTALESNPPSSSRYVESLRNHYRGNEFQLGMVDLLTYSDVAPVAPEIIEQFIGFGGDDAEPIPREATECVDSLYAYRAAAEQFVAGLTADFEPAGDGTETWEFPADRLNAALADEIAAIEPCEILFSDLDVRGRLGFTRSTNGSRETITVWNDPGIYIEPRREELFTLWVIAADDVGEPPATRDPAPLLSLTNTFLVTIDKCGELPWIYSNFAAADTYYPPGEHVGPVFLYSDWLCEDEVPPDRRL